MKNKKVVIAAVVLLFVVLIGVAAYSVFKAFWKVHSANHSLTVNAPTGSGILADDIPLADLDKIGGTNASASEQTGVPELDLDLD